MKTSKTEKTIKNKSKKLSLKKKSKTAEKLVKAPARNAKKPDPAGGLGLLACRVGDFIQYWGFKKIHGQVWLQVFLASQPLDATTLTQRLKCSKGLVSLAIKDLLNYNVIQQCGKSGRRMVYYRSNPDLTEVILNVLRQREAVMLENIKNALSGARANAGDYSYKEERFAELEEMVMNAQDVMTLLFANRFLEKGLCPTEKSETASEDAVSESTKN